MSKKSVSREAKKALKQIINDHPKETKELIARVKDGTCKCGANPLQVIHGLFGFEPAVRELEDSWECKKCGTIWPKKVVKNE